MKNSPFDIYEGFKLEKLILNELKEFFECKKEEKLELEERKLKIKEGLMGFIVGLKKDYFSHEIRKKGVDFFKKIPNNVLSELSGIKDEDRLERAFNFYKKDNNNSWELSKEGYKDLLFILRQELKVKLDYISGDILSREEKENIKIEYEKNFISQISLNSSKVQIEKMIDNNSCFIDKIICDFISEKKTKEKENQKLEK